MQLVGLVRDFPRDLAAEAAFCDGSYFVRSTDWSTVHNRIQSVVDL